MGHFVSVFYGPSIPPGPDLRIVLIGKAGTGKSAAGNTILGDPKAFNSKLAADPVTKNCEKKTIKWSNRNISVVDTPGIIDTEELKDEIKKCIQLSHPGPNAILLVIQAGKFTSEDKTCVETLRELFGREADKYMIVLFTHGDDLTGQETIEDFVSTSTSAAFKEVIQQCGGRFHLFNNRSRDRYQVVELIKKIDHMVTSHHYN